MSKISKLFKKEQKIIPMFQMMETKGVEIKKLLMMKNLLLSKLATIEN